MPCFLHCDSVSSSSSVQPASQPTNRRALLCPSLPTYNVPADEAWHFRPARQREVSGAEWQRGAVKPLQARMWWLFDSTVLMSQHELHGVSPALFIPLKKYNREHHRGGVGWVRVSLSAHNQGEIACFSPAMLTVSYSLDALFNNMWNCVSGRGGVAVYVCMCVCVCVCVRRRTQALTACSLCCC